MTAGRVPFQIGRVLGRTFAIWGRSFLQLVFLTAVIHSPLIVHAILAVPGPDAKDPGWRAFVLVQNVGQPLLGFLATAAVIHGVFQQLRGRPVGIGRCIAVCLGRFLPVLGILLLLALLAVVGLIPVGFIVGARGDAIAQNLMSVAVVLWLAFLWCMFWVAIPVTVVERQGVVASLRRSAELTRGSRLRIFVVLLVVVAIVYAVSVIGTVAFGSHPATQVWLGLLVAITVGALGPVANAVGYHDLRVAREGVGIEDLVRVFE